MSERITPRGPLPANAENYRTIGPFDGETLPAGLRSEHRLKAGSWALLTLSQGRLTFVWDDSEGGRVDFVAPAELVIPPEVPHHLEIEGPFTLTIAFHRETDA